MALSVKEGRKIKTIFSSRDTDFGGYTRSKDLQSYIVIVKFLKDCILK